MMERDAAMREADTLKGSGEGRDGDVEGALMDQNRRARQQLHAAVAEISRLKQKSQAGHVEAEAERRLQAKEAEVRRLELQAERVAIKLLL